MNPVTYDEMVTFTGGDWRKNLENAASTAKQAAIQASNTPSGQKLLGQASGVVNMGMGIASTGLNAARGAVSSVPIVGDVANAFGETKMAQDAFGNLKSKLSPLEQLQKDPQAFAASLQPEEATMLKIKLSEQGVSPDLLEHLDKRVSTQGGKRRIRSLKSVKNGGRDMLSVLKERYPSDERDYVPIESAKGGNMDPEDTIESVYGGCGCDSMGGKQPVNGGRSNGKKKRVKSKTAKKRVKSASKRKKSRSRK